MATSSLYTPLAEAAAELQRRRERTTLQYQVAEAIADDIPCLLQDQPCAVLFRHIGTPDREMARFAEAAATVGLIPLCLEFSEDKFISRNRDKAKLGKLCFGRPGKREGEWHFEYVKAFDFAAAERQPLSALKTSGGQSLVNFHHHLLHETLPQIETCDVSAWVLRHGQKAQEYYRDFFTLFLAHGILCESFLEDEDEGLFTRDVIRPAFEAVAERFHHRPLVVELVTPEEWRQKHWWSYPDELREPARQLLQPQQLEIKK